MVHAAQQSETVDDQHVSLSCFLGSGLCVAHHFFVLYQRKNLAQMILTYDMRSYQQTPVLMLIEERNEYLLIRWPGTACHKNLIVLFSRDFSSSQSLCNLSLAESITYRQLLGSLLDLEHTVKTGISHHVDSSYANTFEQALTFLVLHEETGKALQYSCIAPAIPLEEHLVLAEDAAHTVGRNIAMLQNVKEV